MAKPVPEQAKRRRSKEIYIRDEDVALWDAAVLVARELGIPLSEFVADALREYRPIKTFHLGLDQKVAA